MSYIASIGLEVHVQLKTRSKMFCASPVEFGAEPNTHTCPVCLGLPGALPVMNHEALRMTVLTGLMLGCEIAPTCKFDRKNYFYPDMPKNYQISQYDMPLCTNGSVPLHDLAYPKDAQKTIASPDKEVHLVRIHLEEDVAKSFHFEKSTGIDFNRAGTPLMEIVTQPELNSPEEAFAFLTSLKLILIYGAVSDADMEKGNLRCEANVSVRKVGETGFNNKVELKNLNSVRFMQKAIEFEIERQIKAHESGEGVSQETRLWDEKKNETRLMRSKEDAHDYRYFPEPDLQPLAVTDEFIEAAKREMPELPDSMRERFIEDYQLGFADASQLVSERALAEYFETTSRHSLNPRLSANWVLGELMRELNASGKSASESLATAEDLAELIKTIEAGTINNNQAKEVFAEMFATGKPVAQVIAEKGFEQVSDAGEIEKIVDQVFADNEAQVTAFRGGNEKLFGFFVGQVMKASHGKANPKVVNELLRSKL